MFCTSCGTQMPSTALKCPQFRASISTAAATAALNAAAQSGAIKGFIVLIASYFTMRIKTLRLTARQLRELGAAGRFDVGTTNVPHFSWPRVAGNIVVSLVIVLILLYGLYAAVSSLGQLKYSPTMAIGGLIGKPILAVLAAVAADWVIRFYLELIGITVDIANYVRAIANRPH